MILSSRIIGSYWSPSRDVMRQEPNNAGIIGDDDKSKLKLALIDASPMCPDSESFDALRSMVRINKSGLDMT